MPAPQDQTIQNAAPTRKPQAEETPEALPRFWDRVAEGYAAKPVPSEEIYRMKLAITRKYLKADADVLELACGTGSTALKLSPHVRRFRASDFSPKMIEIARAKAEDAEVTNVEFVCSSIREECASATLHDAVLAHSVFHLLSDWRSAIEAAHRKLNPCGVLISSTLCLRDSHPWLRWFTPLGAALGLMPPLIFFTRDELKQQLRDAGFEIEQWWQPNARTGLFLVARKVP